ncbi:anti-sigma factor [Phaeobacter sp. QD34_3]|uniref:anti-sigma factor family protein n=1 Tax=unclassified Phaeobacter TaxID=2621772 RepID=UPI00237F340B|nr:MULTISPECIES: anti-sigma factor [unclassified Phaeobacter]MDE4132557.1 anti-sigma factor [Phaeobacter sp. QD34_3]MDE4136194.1 anti-sigma factor [Phaeobacter sp. QD34_24]MDE4174444.1 anti-sigma factor [Phaeobacter sp. PT47_59]
MTLETSIEELIQRSIDGELSQDERDHLMRHLMSHPDDAALHDRLQRQTALIDQSVPVPSAAHLLALRKRKGAGPGPIFRIAASIVIFAVGLGAGAVLPLKPGGEEKDLTAFALQAKAAHALYVSEVLHPVEVAASEKDHLQTWLSNRLGAAIIAPELGESGYSLIGGRLLPAGDRASALFMYENEKGDRLSLLATHGETVQSQSFRFQQEDGFLIVYWQDGPWQYSLIGDAPREPMGAIAHSIHGQLI